MKKIDVTKTFLPPFEEYIEYLKSIWESSIVTKDGPYVKEFESKLREYTKVAHVITQVNGTIALQISIKALKLHGEVITTPFTFAATSGSLVWEGCRPIFVDIDPETLNIDPDKIEPKITRDTTAILPVHVYGNPCDIDRINDIAKNYNLKTIYDGAHAFGVEYKNRSIFSYGDISMASFQATKALHTFEGGAIFTNSNDIAEKVRELSYFGMKDDHLSRDGTNAKMNELSAVMGILGLKYFDDCTKKRKQLYEFYISFLKHNNNIQFQKITGDINYSYFPVILKSTDYKDNISEKLKNHNIFPKPYFYPSLEKVFSDHHRIDCKIAYDISNRILCLPLSTYMIKADVEKICGLIQEVH
jgi:dTDP-4-amino-4,6-dideoxygalactose transaminase